MKTTFNFFMIAAFVLTGLNHVYAQSAASSSSDVNISEVDTTAKNLSPQQTENENPTIRGIRTPEYIENLFTQGKTDEALAEFEKFKATQKDADPFHLMYLEMTIYRQAAASDPKKSNLYLNKMDGLVQQLIKKYPNNSDIYLLQITPNSSDEQVIELATKAINADPTNEAAYAARTTAFFNIGKTKEACDDLEKLSYKKYLPEYGNCLRLKREASQEK